MGTAIVANAGATLPVYVPGLRVFATAGAADFALTWWSFTFPVGTCVTGQSARKPLDPCDAESSTPP
jgi:hypothetical protein